MTSWLRRYVDRHNDGVRTGDFAPMLALFRPDAVFEFVGFEIGTLEGLTQITEAFETSPPTDELVILDVSVDGARFSAVYTWRGDPSARGELTIEGDPGGIRRVSVKRGRPGGDSRTADAAR